MMLMGNVSHLIAPSLAGATALDKRSIRMNYKRVQDFVTDMIINENKIFFDTYGRRWKYNDFKFYFSDLGKTEFTEKVSCLHLYKTGIYTDKS